MAVGEEHLIGEIPSRSGEDYDPNAVSPTWGQVIQLLNNENIHHYAIVIIGVLGSPPGKISGASYVRGKTDTLRAIRDSGATFAESLARSMDPAWTADIAARLLNLSQVPEHITGIVIRPID